MKNEPQFDPSDNQASRLILDVNDLNNWQTDNQQAWNLMARDGHRLAQPASDELFANPLKSVDSVGWLGNSIAGKQVLCLAAGGGRQGPLYAAAGAQVVVVDLSPAMLQIDREVASKRGLELRTIEASMDHLSVLANDQFDIVIHPVSTCYVPDVRPVFSEIARVLRSGGIYVSQHKQPVNLQASLTQTGKGYEIGVPYYRTTPLPGVPTKSAFREPGATEYLHRWEQLIGVLCRSGFVIEDLLEPYHAKADSPPGSVGHRSQFVAPYVRIKARRR